MRVVYPDQIREIDRRCAYEYGIPTLDLMKNAGYAVYNEILKRMGQNAQKIVFICGKGNNGGDGLAAAEHFSKQNAEVKVFLLEENSNYEVLKNIDSTAIVRLGDCNFDLLKRELGDADVIVDAIFGTGLNTDVIGLYAQVIDEINSVKENNPGIRVAAIDIPSGINGLTGAVMGSAVKADITVVLAALKAGNLIYPGKEYCGRMVVADIGVPEELLTAMKIKIFETEASLVKEVFPKRKADSNKGTYAKVGIISGSAGMTGAGLMASKAALRTGAGVVYNIVPQSLSYIYETALLETVTIPVKTEELFFDEGSVDAAVCACESMDVIAMGPGLGQEEATAEFLFELLRRINSMENAYQKTLVLDADALNIIAEDISILKEIDMTCILTPHPGEMARLCGVSVKDVQADRINSARFIAEEYEKIIVLKGVATVTAFPDGNVYINPTGNPSMAKAGSGDVLCGIIAAMAAFSGSELAAPCGVYLHGLAGDIACGKYGEYSVLAGDLIENISDAIMKITKK